MMKVCYTGWTWIKSADPEVAKEQLAQSFRECKFLGYDYVENFAFIRDYFKDDPEALVQLQKDCGVGIAISRKWNRDAASTASALPSTNASRKCSRLPAPPEAITGMPTDSETARVSSRS